MYTREQILETITDILVKDFECSKDRITPEAKLFEDLDLDSIDAVDLVVRLQSFVKQRVNPQEFSQIRTVSDVVTAIENIVNKE